MTAPSDQDDRLDEAGAASGRSEAADAPLIQVVKGNPTDEEVAALVAALRSVITSGGEGGVEQRNMWGHAVDKLRYPVFSWHRVILLERTHLRR